MKTIWKYPLQVTDIQYLHLPENSTILSLQVQDGIPRVWVLLDDEELKESELEIYMFGTGHKVYADVEPTKFIGTFQLLHGNLVFHVFYKEFIND